MAVCSAPKNMELQKLLEDNFANKHIPVDGIIELTHSCNFRCIHCYGQNERHEKDLSYEQWVNIFQQLKDEGCLCLALTGGEVLCRKDFPELYKKAKEMGFIVVVLSNASLLTEEIAKLFYDYPLAYFSTTMYGSSRETYKKVTGLADNYDKFMNGISLLQKYNIPIELKTVALKENYNDIKNIYEYAVKNKFPFRCTVTVRCTNDGNDETQDHSITPEQALKLDTEILTNRAEFWKDIALHPKPQPKTDERRKNKCKYLCNVGNNGFMIDADGYAHICMAERNKGFSLLEHSFKEYWNNVITKIACEKAEIDYPCLNCKDFRYCEQCSAQMELDKNNNTHNFMNNKCKLARLRHQWCDDYATEYNNKLKGGE